MTYYQALDGISASNHHVIRNYLEIIISAMDSAPRISIHI